MEINEDLVIQKLPSRPPDGNKGTFGKVLIISGSENFPGAAILSVMAAARTGAGLITLATEKQVYKIAVPKIPFATFLDFSEVDENLGKYDSVLIGPGLKDNSWFKSEKLRQGKLVFDAEALNLFSENKDWFKAFAEDAILTPHPGEMSRLAKLSIDEIQSKRKSVVKKFSKLWNKTIILKGANTLIGNPQGEVYEADFANPLLATAGTGDVLSGIVAGFLAQGLNFMDASVCAVYIHGLAGEKLKDKFNDRGATSLDLIEELPGVFNILTNLES